MTNHRNIFRIIGPHMSDRNLARAIVLYKNAYKNLNAGAKVLQRIIKAKRTAVRSKRQPAKNNLNAHRQMRIMFKQYS